LNAEFDFVVVGAGTAGCVMAARLSEDPAVSVCLIEAGGPARHPFIHVPALVGPAIMHKGLGWGLMSEPQSALNQRRIPLPRGKVIGGSGSINGMAYHRGLPQDYDDWAAAGNAGWSWNEVLPYFVRSENNANLRDSALHGIEGPVHVEHVHRPNALNQDFIDAFASLGQHAHCADFAGPNPTGYGLRQATIYRGRRDSSAAAYLKPAMTRPNLTVLTRTQVTRINLQAATTAVSARATGVEIVTREGLRQLHATREVILCSGAIHSPQLLMLSGIGPAAQLQAVGVTTRVDLPGVGANYHDHPALAVTLEMQDTTSYGLSWRALPRNAWSLLEYLFARRGQLASNVFESTAFIPSDVTQDRPNIQIAFQPARRNPTAFPLPLGHGFAMSIVNLYPRSRGRVTLASNRIGDAPRVDPGLFTDPSDIEPMLHGLRLVRRLCAAPPLARYRAQEMLPGPGAHTDAELIAYLRRAAATAHHPVGTCRMGHDQGAVVTPDLRVHGVDALRVVDASVFPSIVGGNTNAPVVMVAEKTADLIRKRSTRQEI
jgi:choline dehydrogenase